MFILFFLFWIFLNGKFTLELVIIGLILSAIVYAFACFFLSFSFKKDIKLCKCIPLLLFYVLVLILEVVKSNLNIISLIWSSKHPEPEIVHFKVDLNTRFLRVIYANSITLTPGTITILIDDDQYVVHALRKEYASGINNSRLLHILQKIEGVYNAW